MPCTLRPEARKLFPPEAIPHLESGMVELAGASGASGPAWGAASILLRNLFEPMHAETPELEDP